MTENDVRKLLFAINAVFPNYKAENPEATIKIWTEFLSDQDPVAIGMSLKNYARTNTSGFAPDIGKLIQGARELTQPKTLTASEAWGKVLNAIHNSAYGSEEEFKNLPPAVQVAVGSARQLQEWAMEEDFDDLVASSNFRRSYTVALERERKDALLTDDCKRLMAEMAAPRLEERK